MIGSVLEDTMERRTSQQSLRSEGSAILLAAMMLLSVVAMTAAVPVPVAADLANSDVEINQLEGTDADGEEVVLDQNDEGGDEQEDQAIEENPGDEIDITFTIDPGSTAIERVTVEYEAVHDDTTASFDLDTADRVEDRTESVPVPEETGFYAVTLFVEDEDGNEASADDIELQSEAGVVAVFETDPSANIENPDEDFAENFLPEIEITANSGLGLGDVEIWLQDEDDDFYDPTDGVFEDGSFDDDAISAADDIDDSDDFEDGSTSGDFAKYADSISATIDLEADRDDFEPGTYTLTVNPIDQAGNELREDGSSGPPAPPGDSEDVVEVEFQYVHAPPDVDLYLDGYDATDVIVPEDVSSLDATVNITDDEFSTSVIESVSVAAPGLGVDTDDPAQLTHDVDLEYDGDVSGISPEVGHKTSVDVTATVETTTSADATDTVTLEVQRVPTSVDVSVETDVVGVAEDSKDSVRVAVTNAEDDTGTAVDRTLSFDISGEDGDIELDQSGAGSATFDPEEIDPNDAGQTADITLEDDETETNVADDTASITLVHEAYTLTADAYHPAGTPAAADEIALDGVGQVLDWDGEQWVELGPGEVAEAGAGYLLYPGANDDGRIGYTFADGTAGTATETLAAGSGDSAFHLVGATPDLESYRTIDSQEEWEDDLLQSESSFGEDTNVVIHAPDGEEIVNPDSTPPVDWSSEDADDLDNPSVEAFGAYWVELDAEDGADDLDRYYSTGPYEPEP